MKLLIGLVAIRPAQHRRVGRVRGLGPEPGVVLLEQERRRDLADVLRDARHARRRRSALLSAASVVIGIVLLPGAGVRLAHDRRPPARRTARRRRRTAAGFPLQREFVPEEPHGVTPCFARPFGASAAIAVPPVGDGQAVAVRYFTVFVPTRFQVMYRSARNATAFIWNMDAYTVVASAGEAGALSICSEASVEASIVDAAVIREQDVLRRQRDDVRRQRVRRNELQPLVGAAADPDAGEFRRAVQVRAERQRERVRRREQERQAIDGNVVRREVIDQPENVRERVRRRRRRRRAVRDRRRIDARHGGDGGIDELRIEVRRDVFHERIAARPLPPTDC